MFPALIQSDRFKVEYDLSNAYPNMSDAKLLDHNGNPILYFPARPGPPVVTALADATQPNSYLNLLNPTSGIGTTVQPPLYNTYDNYYDCTPAANNRPFLTLPEMEYILGDRNLNGHIDAGEQAVTTLPYLLWTAGPSNKYGLLNVDITTLPPVPAGVKCDAVCNFDVPPDLKK